jgi:hypothetical protein
MKKNRQPLKLRIMKKHPFTTIALGMLILFSFSACQKEESPLPQDQDILPENFKVEITSSLSYDPSTLKSAMIDTLKGSEIYHHLGTFIRVGEAGAEIVEDVIRGIRVHHINRPMTFSFQSDDDGRIKNAAVVANAEYENEYWEFQMTITDAESEGNEDGGKALQIFWNRFPIKGIALMKPFNIDRLKNADTPDAMYRVDYSEARDHGYDAEMLVYAAGLPVADPLEDPYSMRSLKMFAGRKGNTIDVYGNSNHPNAILIAGNSGFTFSFIASGNNDTDLGIAEVGLPPSNLDQPSRNILLGYYSIKNVLTREIYQVWPNIDDESVEAFLFNAEAPGYFDEGGFVVGGTAPGPGYEMLELRLPFLSPYNPREISNLDLQFN